MVWRECGISGGTIQRSIQVTVTCPGMDPKNNDHMILQKFKKQPKDEAEFRCILIINFTCTKIEAKPIPLC